MNMYEKKISQTKGGNEEETNMVVNLWTEQQAVLAFFGRFMLTSQGPTDRNGMETI